MREAYTYERLYRTVSILTTGYDNLHERLPRAFDDGFSTIAEGDIAQVSQDLAIEFRAIKTILSSRSAPGESSAALSCEDMTPEELEKLAARIDNFFWLFKSSVENKDTLP